MTKDKHIQNQVVQAVNRRQASADLKVHTTSDVLLAYAAHLSTQAPQHPSTLAPEHLSTRAPQHLSTSALQHPSTYFSCLRNKRELRLPGDGVRPAEKRPAMRPG